MTGPRRWSWGARFVLVLFLAGIVALALNWSRIHAKAVTAAAYGARIGCACRFESGRSLSDCRKDFEPGMALVMLSEDDARQSVTARFLPVVSQTAFYRPGQGCVLDTWPAGWADLVD